MGSVSCVSCVSRRCSVNAAETHETVRWESGMRYQTHTPDAPPPPPPGGFIPPRNSWQNKLPPTPRPPPRRALRRGPAPAGGKLPDSWRIIVLDAIQAGMHIRSGLHTFIGDDPEFAAAAGAGGGGG